MMREILFRAKDSTGKWHYGTPVIGGMDNEVCFMKQLGEHDKVTRPYTIGQYTGLKDKNGVKIFEGDIVNGVIYSAEHIGVVIWITEIASFGVRYVNRTDPTIIEKSSFFRALRIGMHNEYCAKIIGNIYDNPELLKEDSK